jgi:hypothetical protein
MRKRPQDAPPSEKKTRQATENNATNEANRDREKEVWPLALSHIHLTPPNEISASSGHELARPCTHRQGETAQRDGAERCESLR